MAIDYQIKAQLLLANERLMYWKRHSGFKRYVFIAKYSKDGERVNREEEAFNNKFRQIKTQINTIESEVLSGIDTSKTKINNRYNEDRRDL